MQKDYLSANIKKERVYEIDALCAEIGAEIKRPIKRMTLVNHLIDNFAEKAADDLLKKLKY